MRDTDRQISEAVERFVEELTVLVRQAAIASVAEALGAQATPTAAPGRGRKKVAGRKAAGRKKAPGRKAAGRKAAGGRRSSADVESSASDMLAHVSANPGSSIGDVAKALGTTSRDLRLPAQKLIEDGKLRTTGQKRGTRYYAGRGKSSTGPTAKKKTGRKKKAARRSTAKKSA